MNRIERWLFGVLSCAVLITCARSGDDRTKATPMMESVRHLQDFQVVEFRRYLVKDGESVHFAKYFESYFPEAFEQLGAMVFGQFLDRDSPNQFVWLRGFKDISARAIVNAAFYYGPLWKEHRVKLNTILTDSDNVILMRPLHADRGIAVLPAVDPVAEDTGAQGIVVAQIFPIRKGSEDTFARQAEAAFAGYRIVGVREAGVLVSLDVANNFPQLPIRTDGPWLIWLGVVEDNATLDSKFATALEAAEESLTKTGSLRGAPERLVLDPTPRSRLRWLPDTR
jgi:hypothetical protein